jgi:hypothetical protein
MGLATTTMVAKVTVRAPPNMVHVGRSSQGPLLMTSRKSPCGPREVHFFVFSKVADIVYNNFLQLSTVLHGLVG